MSTPRHEHPGLVVGLTGGIGSGKSAAADCFAALGIPVVDTDAIAHELTASGGAAMPAILASFGAQMLTTEGALNRVAMRQRAFTEPAVRRQLEAILHPLIRQISSSRIAAAQRRMVSTNSPVGASDTPYVILVVALLVESANYCKRVDRVLVIDCAVETQITRVMARSAMDREQVLQILAAQATREKRLAAADDVISNEGSLEQLGQQVAALDTAYRANRGIFPTKD